jgi:hypothetical protein
MTILPEVSARLKTKAALLSESPNLMLSLLGQIEDATRRIDSNITSLLADVQPSRLIEGLRECVAAVRGVVTAARTAGYASQAAPGVHERT